MRQQVFESLRGADWDTFESMLVALETGGETDAADFPRLYRGVCRDLALARDRMFAQVLTDRLNDLALRGHQLLYRVRAPIRRRWLDYLVVVFPRAVRREARLFWVMSILFYGSGLAMGAAVQQNPDLIFSFIDPGQVETIESMYDPSAEHFGTERGADSDVGMFGFYILNNIGIAFRTFASGILFGVGVLFTIIFNGVFLGLVAGHLTRVGFTSTFWPFVVGHGAFELTAIVLAGVAGMRMGLALISPGSRTRVLAMRESALEALPIISGAGAMLLIAAAIEAFWSSSVLIPASVKYAVGALFWLLVFFYLFSAGRGQEERRAD